MARRRVLQEAQKRIAERKANVGLRGLCRCYKAQRLCHSCWNSTHVKSVWTLDCAPRCHTQTSALCLVKAAHQTQGIHETQVVQTSTPIRQHKITRTRSAHRDQRLSAGLMLASLHQT